MIKHWNKRTGLATSFQRVQNISWFWTMNMTLETIAENDLSRPGSVASRESLRNADIMSKLELLCLNFI